MVSPINTDDEVMSDRIACPKCQAAQDFKPVTLLPANAEANLGRLFKGTLNQCTCAACGSVFRVDSPLLYRDDRRKLLVYFAADVGRMPAKEAEAYATQCLNDLLPEGEASVAGYQLRLVFTRPKFIEKIALARADLDDRLVEYIKYQLFARRQPELDPARQDLLYDFSNPDKENLCFVVFDRASGKATSGLHLAQEVYTELAESFLAEGGLRDELESLFSRYFVDANRLF